MTKEQAIHNFWSSFGNPAYDESTVPDREALPYTTYTVGVDDFLYPVSLTASLWYEGTSWTAITAKLNEIAEAISPGGKIVHYDNGAFWIKKGHPFAIRVPDENDAIRRILMNVEIEFIGG